MADGAVDMLAVLIGFLGPLACQKIEAEPRRQCVPRQSLGMRTSPWVGNLLQKVWPLGPLHWFCGEFYGKIEGFLGANVGAKLGAKRWTPGPLKR